MAQGARDETGLHAGFAQMGGVRMPEGMKSDAHFGAPGTVCGGAEGPLDTGTTHGGTSRRTLWVIAPGGGKAPGCVTVGFPGGAEPSEGLCGQGDGAVFGARAAVDMDLEARAIAVGDLQREGFMKPESQAINGGAGGVIVEGGGRLQESLDLLPTEDGGEAVGGVRTQERERGPVALEHMLREEADATVADAHGGWGEAVGVFPVQEGVLQFLFGDAVGGFVGELGQQVDVSDRGFLRPFAFAAEVERREHLLTQGAHAISPFVRRVVDWRRKTS
jgi:hypothetical protein